MYVGIKCALFNTKSTTVITALYPDDLWSSTMKSILRVSYHTSGTERRYNLSIREYHISSIHKHRSQVLIYYPTYQNIWGHQ